MPNNKTRKKLRQAFHEVTHDPPRIVGQTRKKFGERRAARQQVAIALSKVRKRGAHVPPPPKKGENKKNRRTTM